MRSLLVTSAFVCSLLIHAAAIAQVFSPHPTASSGTIPMGTGQSLYGNFGIGADGANPPPRTYNVHRKYDGLGQVPDGGNPPYTDLHTLDPDPDNPTSAFWNNLDQGGTLGAGSGFTTGFKAPGTFIGTSAATSSYEEQLLKFGPVIDVGAIPGNFNGDSSNRRQWELRVGFLEDPDGFLDNTSPNTGEIDLWDGVWGSDGVSMNFFIGSNDEGSQIGSSNWFTMSQFEGADMTAGFYGQSGSPATAIASENQRNNLPMFVTRVVTNEPLDDLLEPTSPAGTHTAYIDTGIAYDDFVEVSWNMQLNDPTATPGTREAREVRFTAKVGNVNYTGLFDPGDENNPVVPNQTNDPGSPYLDGFFDWQNATPMFYLGADNETAPGAVGVQGIFAPGDFDGDGTVDDTDLAKWTGDKFQISTSFSRGDGDQNGMTDVRDVITWTGALFGTSANAPQFVYDSETGELSLNGGGADINAFSVEVDPAQVNSVTNANLPNADTGWEVQNFGGAIQGFDITLSEDGGANGATASHVIATLAAGLSAADFGNVLFSDGTGSGTASIRIDGGMTSCDFDNSSSCDIADLNLLMYTGLGTADAQFDLDGSGSVDLADRDAFLRQIGSLPGDANLDGKDDAMDLNAVGTNWQSTDLTSWADGDFNGDGRSDAQDLNDLGIYWQMTADDFANQAAASAVPETSAGLYLLVGLMSWLGLRRR